MIYHVVSASEDIGMGSTTDTWRYATGKQRFDGTSTRFAWRLLIGVGKYTVIWTLLCCTPLERPNICGFHCLGEKLQKNEHCESSWYIPFKQHKGCVSLAWYLSISIFFYTDIYIRLIYICLYLSYLYILIHLYLLSDPSTLSINIIQYIYIHTYLYDSTYLSIFLFIYVYWSIQYISIDIWYHLVLSDIMWYFSCVIVSILSFLYYMSDGSYLRIWKVVFGRTPVCQKHYI
jgi:hypothetical protein